MGHLPPETGGSLETPSKEVRDGYSVGWHGLVGYYWLMAMATVVVFYKMIMGAL